MYIYERNLSGFGERLPAGRGGSPPFFSPAIDEAYDQLDIIREAGLPLEFDLGNMQEKQSLATELIRQMENNKDAVHRAAINALGKLRLKSATEPLLKQLAKWHSGDPAADIVRALGEIGDERAANLVVVMLDTHVKVGVRSEAALALGKIGGAKALAALKRRLNQEKEASVKADILKAMTPVIHWTFRSPRHSPEATRRGRKSGAASAR